MGEFSDSLGPFAELVSPVATVHPHKSTDSLDIPRVRRVFGVGPGDTSETYIDRCLDALEYATRLGSRIVVFPELSQTEETIERLATRLPDDDQLLICMGSAHGVVDGLRSNTAVTVLTGLAPVRLEHVKFNPFVQLPLRRDRRPLRRYQTEDLQVSSPFGLKVYEAGQGRICVLICKDFLHAEVPALLTALGVTVLLVPSMSPRTNQFAIRAGALAGSGQTLSVVSNGPLLWSESTGNRSSEPDCIVTWPIQNQPQIAKSLSEPCVIVVSPENTPMLKLLGP